ncbi:Trm112 family protein [Thermosphaera sp.]|uniref:Trm112 family protein n=1 Tax=Thermosphaera aggregans TaxID=54254 RepID=A0A7C2FEN1_9CREN
MMRYWGIDFIRCVHCKHHPLEIIVLESEVQNIDTSNMDFPLCKTYCAYLKKEVKPSEQYPCGECLKTGIKTAVLYCPNCNRWYPVKEGIVYLLTDNRRKPESDKKFLQTFRDKLPAAIVEKGLPYNLSE